MKIDFYDKKKGDSVYTVHLSRVYKMIEYKEHDTLLFAPYWRMYVTQQLTDTVVDELTDKKMIKTPLEEIDDEVFVNIAQKLEKEDKALFKKLMKKPGFVDTRMVVNICKQAVRDWKHAR